jgi:hypothetical protein
MIAARITRRQRRDPVRFLLLHRIEWTDKHPGVTLAGLAVVAVIGGLVNGWLR